MDRTTKCGICDRIQDARNAAKMSQKQLGDSIHIGQRSISKFENGEQLPSIEQLFDLAEALKTDPVKLLFDVRKDNFDIANETGLSDASISLLKQNQRKDGWMNKTENRAAAVINALISNRILIDALYGYLFSDFSELKYFNPFDLDTVHRIQLDDGNKYYYPEEKYVKASHIKSIHLDSFEALFRISLIDQLAALRKSKAITEQRTEKINGDKVGRSVYKGFLKSKEIDMTDEDSEAWMSTFCYNEEENGEEE